MSTLEHFGLQLNEYPGHYDVGTLDHNDPSELAVAVYSNLGLVTDIPKARKAFSKEISSLQLALPESVTTRPHDLLVVPRLGQLSMVGLINRYNALPLAKDILNIKPYWPLWDQYSTQELSQGQSKPIEARAIILDAENDYSEPGLYFCGQTVRQQVRSLSTAEERIAGSEAFLSTVSISGYVIYNAMQLVRGAPLLDRATFSRFVELEGRPIRDVSGDELLYPLAFSFDFGRITLAASYYGSGSNVGVRLWAAGRHNA